MTVRALRYLGAVLAATGAMAANASAAPAPPDLRVLTTSQSAALDTGSLKVRVAVKGPARVDLDAQVSDFVRIPVPSANRRAGAAVIPPVTIARGRVEFRKRGQRTVALRLTAAGRRALGRCGGTQPSTARSS